MQYNKFEFNEAQYGPYPAKVSDDRVTDEHAPVDGAAAADPIFNTPNKITEAAWNGWVQERGLYSSGEHDSRYRDLVQLEDPFPYNKGAKRGALVEAAYGKGRWVYVGLGLWRELPAGVDGAYQLLANLISLGKPRPAPAPVRRQRDHRHLRARQSDRRRRRPPLQRQGDSVRRAALPFALAAAFACLGLLARAADDPEDAGTFTLFKFEQAIGEERYEIRPGADGSSVLTSKFLFTDRGTTVPLDATLSSNRDRLPGSFRHPRRHGALVENRRRGEAGRRGRHDPRRVGVTPRAGAGRRLHARWLCTAVDADGVDASTGRRTDGPASVALLPHGTARIERRGQRRGDG